MIKWIGFLCFLIGYKLSAQPNISQKDPNYFNSHTVSFSRIQCNVVTLPDSLEFEYQSYSRLGRDTFIIFYPEGIDTALIFKKQGNKTIIRAYRPILGNDGSYYVLKGLKRISTQTIPNANVFKEQIRYLSDTAYERRKWDYNDKTPRIKIKGAYGGKFFCFAFPSYLPYEDEYDERALMSQYYLSYLELFRK